MIQNRILREMQTKYQAQINRHIHRDHKILPGMVHLIKRSVDNLANFHNSLIIELPSELRTIVFWKHVGLFDDVENMRREETRKESNPQFL